MKTHLSFVRKDINHIENMVVVKFKHKKSLVNPYQVFKAFKTGITRWVENTEKGQNLWNYTCEDLNIGDLLGEYGNKELNKFLSIEGIKSWKPIYELVDQEEFSYDKVLASPNEKEDNERIH
jgi:hypothetical protein